MPVSEVVSVMKQLIDQIGKRRNLEVYIDDSEVNDGNGDKDSADGFHYNPVKIIRVDDMNKGSTILSVIIRVREDSKLYFDSSDDNVGMHIHDDNGCPTSKPTDVDAILIADGFFRSIGRQYFFKKV